MRTQASNGSKSKTINRFALSNDQQQDRVGVQGGLGEQPSHCVGIRSGSLRNTLCMRVPLTQIQMSCTGIPIDRCLSRLGV